MRGSFKEPGFVCKNELLKRRAGWRFHALLRNRFNVIEGNRRLGAVMLLNDPSLAPAKKNTVRGISEEAKHKPNELPAFIYEDRDEVLDYLGYRHITGIQQWDSLAKAKYLEQLRKKISKLALKKQFAVLAKTIGSTPDYVARLLTGLSIYKEIEANEFYDIEGLDEQSINFSLITTALQYKNLTEFLGLKRSDDPTAETNKEGIKEFTKWVFERSDNKTLLGESRNLRLLNAVVDKDNRAALAAFRKGTSLFDAAMLTGIPSQVFQDAVKKAKSHLEVARDYVHKIEDPDQVDVDRLKEIEQIASSLWKLLNLRITEKKETH